MIEIIDDIISSRWCQKKSPIQSNVTKGNPKLCVITGPNMSGKSLLRKLIHIRYADRNWDYIHFSQEGRSAKGDMNFFVYGSEKDESTGFNSVKIILKMIKSAKNYKTTFGVMLDEPEIGCSEEVQFSIGQKLAN